MLCSDYVRHQPRGILGSQHRGVQQVASAGLHSVRPRHQAVVLAGRGRVILFTLANHYSYRVLHSVGAVPRARIPLSGFK